MSWFLLFAKQSPYSISSTPFLTADRLHGGIERRVASALQGAAEDFSPAVKAAVTKSGATFARLLYDHMKMHGLRFRLAGEAPEENPSLVRRYETFRHRPAADTRTE